MRPRTRLRMPLKTERGFVGARKTLQAAIEQAHMRDAAIRGQGFRIHCKTVILAGDHYAARIQVLHRVVRAMMTEFHLDGCSTTRQPHQLMTQANAEQRHALIQQLADGRYRVIARLRIAGAVGQKHAIGL